MMEKTDTNNMELACAGPKTRLMGFASLILAVIAMPFLYISIHRTTILHNNTLDICVVRETSFYNTVHTLCTILPAASVIFAVLSLMRCRRNRTALAAAIPAFAGLLLAFASFTAYFLALLILAYGRSN